MERCKTCKFWREEEELWLGAKECTHAKVACDEVCQEDGVLPLGSYDPEASLFTGPEYGCVHHEMIVQHKCCPHCDHVAANEKWTCPICK